MMRNSGAVPEEAQPRRRGLQAANLGDGRVVAAIIDINDLVLETAVEGGADLGHKRSDIAGLVLDRNYDGKIHATRC